MAIIKVDTSGIEGLRQMVSALKNKTRETLDYILYCERNLDMNTASSERISARINALQKRIAAQQSKVEQYERALTSVNEKFSATDRLIKGKAKEVDYLLEKINSPITVASRQTLKIQNEQADVTKLLSVLESTNVDSGDLIKIIGGFGFAGSTISLAAGLAYNPSVENIGKTAVNGIGLLAKTAKTISQGKTVNMFGLSSTVDAIGFSENLLQSLESYKYNSSYNSANVTGTAKTWQNVGVIAKWGGVALTTVGNFAENVEEYEGEFSNPKMYVETIGETSVDVGLGILVGAGVAAIAGATAPVWAVGVVTTGAVMGINWASEQLFNADLGEVITDTAISMVEQRVERVGNAVKTTAKAISTGWKKIISIFKRGVGDESF